VSSSRVRVDLDFFGAAVVGFWLEVLRIMKRKLLSVAWGRGEKTKGAKNETRPTVRVRMFLLCGICIKFEFLRCSLWICVVQDVRYVTEADGEAMICRRKA